MGFSDLKARGESEGGHPLHNLKSLYSCCTCTSLRDAVNQTKLQYSFIPTSKGQNTLQPNQASDLKNPTELWKEVSGPWPISTCQGGRAYLKASSQLSQVQQLHLSSWQLLSRLLLLLHVTFYFLSLLQGFYILLQWYTFTLRAPIEKSNPPARPGHLPSLHSSKTCFSHGTQGDRNLTNQRNQNKVSRTRKGEWQGHIYLKPLIML